ncbi:MAG: fluoride efflux transporter CrcB [Myxococcota bacterium]|nr:fluoride efflux transporter CrcB [Myxococcota bacterium]
MKWGALMLGGALGATLRYALTVFVDQRIAALFPWGTLAVNALGCFLIGVVLTIFDQRELFSPVLRLFVVTGVLGAFTTFSTFSLESWRLVEAGRAGLAFANIAASLLLCLAATFVGIAVAQRAG